MVQKETKLFKEFFRRNLVLIIIPALLITFAGIIYQLNKPTIFSKSAKYEVVYNLENIQSKIALTDQAIASIRSLNLQKSLGLDQSTDLVVFKSGPLLIDIVANSKNIQQTEKDFNKVSSYLSKNYQVKPLGSEISNQDKHFSFFILLLFSFSGLGLGVITSLAREYLKNY